MSTSDQLPSSLRLLLYIAWREEIRNALPARKKRKTYGFASLITTGGIIMSSRNIRIQCPHCHNSIVFIRGKKGRWIGRVVGGVSGGWIGSSLGIAGGILGASIAIPATIPALIIGVLAGDRIGKMLSKAICPECGKEIRGGSIK